MGPHEDPPLRLRGRGLAGAAERRASPRAADPLRTWYRALAGHRIDLPGRLFARHAVLLLDLADEQVVVPGDLVEVVVGQLAPLFPDLAPHLAPLARQLVPHARELISSHRRPPSSVCPPGISPAGPAVQTGANALSPSSG